MNALVIAEDRFELARRLSQRQRHHAALELLQEFADSGLGGVADRIQIYDEMGKSSIFLGDLPAAVNAFQKAVSLAGEEASRTDIVMQAQMHLAMAVRYGEPDTAYRMLVKLTESDEALDDIHRAMLFGNLASAQAYYQRYSEALSNTEQSLALFDARGIDFYHPDLYTNLGLLRSELGDATSAEQALLHALELRPGFLPPITELSRLCILQGRFDEGLDYAERALELVWPTFMSYEREEIARLCRVLAQLARSLGETDTAFRLLEKSQLFFGQLRLWREWQEAQELMDNWVNAGGRAGVDVLRANQTRLLQLRQFVTLLDAMNAQEILDEAFSRLLDTRVLYAQLLAEEMGLSESDVERIILAARFADYGLTALEPDVMREPERSAVASKAYQQHPGLTVQMLGSALPQNVLRIIEEHHERVDGTGYPAGKTRGQLDRATTVLQVADAYAEQVAVKGKRHSDAMVQLRADSGKGLDAEVVAAFEALFT